MQVATCNLVFHQISATYPSARGPGSVTLADRGRGEPSIKQSRDQQNSQRCFSSSRDNMKAQVSSEFSQPIINFARDNQHSFGICDTSAVFQAILSLSLVLLGAISASSLTRRSLLPGSQGHSGHSGHHHQPQRHRLGQGRRQPGRGRSRAGARRAARDGDHHEAHEAHPDHQAGGHSEVRCAARH